MKGKNLESLKSKKQLDFLFKHGKNLYSSVLKFIFLPNKSKIMRFVIVIAKKKYKSAVVRNKIRRQIKNILISSPKTGYDVAVLVNENYFDNSFDETAKIIKKNLAKI
ncbi:MAG: ribonuclease P protein component [Mycoplasmataceae bacterium]|jgi:ribonuclease P protein component|nr:ribonuclease P protein component [Mycoplasmataceae bacterium]